MSNKQANTNGTAQDAIKGKAPSRFDASNWGMPQPYSPQASADADHAQQQPASIVGTLSAGDIGLATLSVDDQGLISSQLTSEELRAASKVQLSPSSRNAAAQATVKPQAHISSCENAFLEALDKLRLCFAVLELTRTERTLISEADALAAYIEEKNQQPKLNYPRAARSPAEDKDEELYRSVLIHYQTAISNAMSAIAYMFDDGYRLRQPYYSDAIMNGMRVRLLDRCSVATYAYLYVTNLRGNSHAPLTYSPTPSKAASK